MQKIFTSIIVLALALVPWMVKAQTTMTFTFSQDPELRSDAGADTSVCDTVITGIMLSGAGAGGDGSYAYLWTPSTDLSSATIANPVATPPATTTYSLLVTDGNNCTATDDVTLTVDTCLVGVSQLEGVASVSLYPNPNKGAFRVNASLEKTVGNFTLKVVTVNGQEIYSSELASPARNFTHDVSLPGVSRGVYFVRMEFDGAALERKIIVQ